MLILLLLLLQLCYTTVRPHHAGPTRVALASGAPANPLQTLLFDVQVAVWASSSVPGGRRRLRSASDRTCVVPRTHNSFGDRSYSAAGPRV